MEKESSFSLRAASAFRMATSFSPRAASFSSRVVVSVAMVAFSCWSSVSLRWSSDSFASRA